MCDYTGQHFGASYEDACCIDGFLWDLDSGDSDGLTMGGEIPCPECNTAAYLDGAREEAETTSWGSQMFSIYCGAMIMEGAVRHAVACNRAEADRWISEHPTIESFDWPDRAAVLSGRASPDTIEERPLLTSGLLEPRP